MSSFSRSRGRSSSPLALLAALAVAGVLGLACSSSDAGGGASDAAGSCDSMCKGVGFTSGTADVQPNEVNCFCAGGGTVTAAACTNFCTGAGKAKGSVFKSKGTADDSCQCE